MSDESNQCVQFDMQINLESFAKDEQILQYIKDEVSKLDGVVRVAPIKRHYFRREMRFDLMIELTRPADASGRDISEYLMDSIIDIKHVLEVRELKWRRIESPLL